MHKKLAKLIPDLLGEDLDAESAALEAFYELCERGTLKPADLIGMIEMSGSMPDAAGHTDECPPRHLLVLAADVAQSLGSDARPAVDAIRAVLPSLPSEAIEGAMLVLTEIPTRESVVAYAEILAATPGLKDPPMYDPEAFDDGEGGALFPGIMMSGSTPQQRAALHHMLLAFLEAGQLDASHLAPYAPEFLNELRELEAVLRTLQGDSARRDWRYAEPYLERREAAALMFDIAGRWGTPELLDLVDSLADLGDPWLRMMRAMALLRGGREVEQAELDWIAESPRERYWLAVLLDDLGHKRRLPEACLDHAALAEGAMMEWLTFPTELGREPDELERVHVEVRPVKIGRAKPRPTSYHILRFRVTSEHWAKEDGWMVGMAGGFQEGRAGMGGYTGDTFSHFKRWDELSLAQHVASLLDDESE